MKLMYNQSYNKWLLKMQHSLLLAFKSAISVR